VKLASASENKKAASLRWLFFDLFSVYLCISGFYQILIISFHFVAYVFLSLGEFTILKKV